MAATRDNDWRNSDELLDEINRLVEAGSTGTLFVRTADDHLGCVVFASGEIVSVMFRGVRGMRGIEYVRAFNQSTFHFDENALLWEDPGDLPDTQDILRRLREQSVFSDAGRADDAGTSGKASHEWSALGDWNAADESDSAGTESRADKDDEPASPGPVESEIAPTVARTPPPKPTIVKPPPVRERTAIGSPAVLSKRNVGASPRQAPIALSASELKRTICDTAVSIMGPVGHIICDEAFARAGILGGMDDLENLLLRITSEIDDETDARDFRNKVLTKATPREGATTAPRTGVAAGSAEYNKLREVIESEAIEFLGPLASVLCDEYFRKYSAGNNVVDIGQVINSLVDEIGNPQRSDQFRERIAQRLG